MRRLALVANYVVSFLLFGVLVALAALASHWLLCTTRFPIGLIIILTVGILILLFAAAVKQRNWRAAFTKANVRFVVGWMIFLIFIDFVLADVSGSTFTQELSRNFPTVVFVILSSPHYFPLPFFSWGRENTIFRAIMSTGDLESIKHYLDKVSGNLINELVKGEPSLFFALRNLFEKPEVISLLLEHGADPNLTNKKGTSPLQYAVVFGRNEIAQMLIQHGARIDYAPEGKTLVHLAAEFGKADTVGWLLQQGLDVNARDKAGDTPLHIAVRKGSVPVLEALLAHGADMHVRNENGDTPLDIASTDEPGTRGYLVNPGRREAVRILQQRMASN